MIHIFKTTTKTFAKTLLTLTILVTGGVLISGCNKKRPDEVTTSSSSAAVYPHPSHWTTGHVEYFSKRSGTQGAQEQNCGGCHNSRPKARALSQSITCALNCHAKSTEPTTPNSSIAGTHPAPTQECARCHQNIANNSHKPFAHYPSSVGLCKTCHEVRPGHHDRAGVSTDLSAATCYRCHQNQSNLPHQHQALASGKTCVNCHDPHGSEHRGLLNQPTESLCLSCHTSTPHEGRSVHGMIANTSESCLNCHLAHGSAHPKLLTNQPRELCLNCHNKVIQTQGATPRAIPNIAAKVQETSGAHVPASSGNCTLVCHTPHSSEFDRLLTKPYETQPHHANDSAEVITRSNRLCFQCHNTQLLNKDITSTSTQFRNDVVKDGTITRTNLHWFHVVGTEGAANRNRGRSCNTCHDPHGSTQGHGIRPSFSMGAYDIGISFTPQARGGQCALTCHGPRTYRRAD